MKRTTVHATILTILAVVFFILVASGEDCDGCYSPGAMQFKLVVAGAVTVIMALYFTARYKKFEKMAFDIANQPILETNEATSGVSFAGEGTVVSEKPLTSAYTQTECVYYHAILEKYVNSGKRGRWEVQEQKLDFIPFYLTDDRGRLAIDVTGVDHDNSSRIKNRFSLVQHKDKKKHARNLQVHSEIDCEAVLTKEKFKPEGKKGRWRRSEFVLKPGSQVFVYGYIAKSEHGLVLKEHAREPLIISRKTQKEFVAEFFKGKALIYMVYILMLAGIAMILGALIWGAFITERIASAIFVLAAVIFLIHAIITMYNRIIVLRNRAFNTLSNIEGELKRRFDLIPNLNRVVSQYAAFERDVHSVMAQLRSASVSDPFSGAVDTMAHKQILATLEAYPDLKASETVSDLMILLTDTEERIAYSRTFYNSAAQQYNTAIQQFPSSIVATLGALKPMAYIGVTKQ